MSGAALGPLEIPMGQIISASERFAARRRQAKARAYAEFEALCRGIPRAFVLAGLKAVMTNSEAPLQRLPSPWRERSIKAFRRLDLAKVLAR